MTRRHVLITVPDTEAVVRSASSLGLAPAERESAASLERMPESFTFDHAYVPSPIKRAVAHELMNPQPRARQGGHHSYVVRGSLDHEHLERAQQLRGPNGEPRVFSDPGLALVGVAFGDPPIGGVADLRRLLQLDRLQERHYDGTGVAIALVDNGINLEYLRTRGLQPRFDAARSWSANPASTAGAAPVGHGTMCAFDALIAGSAAILLDFAAVQAASTAGSPISGILSDVIAAYAKLVQLLGQSTSERGFHSLVVSNSWAVPNPEWDFPEGNPGRFIDNVNHPFHAAVTSLIESGADVVFAAGNCGPENPEPSCGFGAGAPTIVGASSYPEVITVAAVDINGRVAGYSSCGPGAIDQRKPDVAGFAHFSGSEAFGVGQPDAGTSAACPLVAGIVAAARSKWPFVPGDVERTPAAIKQRLIAAATHATGEPFSESLGYGVVGTSFLDEPEPLQTEPTPRVPESTITRSENGEKRMGNDKDLLWKLVTEGSFDDIRRFFSGGSRPSLGQPATTVAAPTVATPSGQKLHRSKDGLIETHVLEASGDPTALLQLVREHWALLRDKGLADAQPIKIFAGADDPSSIVYVFRWKKAESRTAAHSDADVAKVVQAIRAGSLSRERLPMMNEVYQGFEYRQFPKQGGVELLRGKCTCRVKLDAFPEEFELDGQNGFVIMHRGPQNVQGNSRLMPVTILAHGADTPNPMANLGDERINLMRNAIATAAGRGISPVATVTAPKAAIAVPGAAAAKVATTVAPKMLMSGTAGPTVRVEQNTELPQFGIIRADGPSSDFPATAMWVVHWRIHTPLGTVYTDPNVPLVFGPTTVQHYPPVGTEFKSATGPVDIYHAETNTVVGKLTPGELTAFDIVVTMDDEVPSSMDQPAAYHVQMFNKHVTDPNKQISMEGLVDDYRVPMSSREQEK